MSLPDSQWLPIAEIAKKVQAGKLQAIDLVELALATVEKHKEFDAVITTTSKRATERAKLIDEQVKAGQSVGRLAGVPFVAKDNFLTFGSETTAASNILKGFEAPYQATVIEKLEAEGAICIAKANLDAFAHGSSTENSDFMVTKNPHDKTRVPGGSSGGSAAAVVLDMAPFAIGTDTGGSIRLPASFCGAVGLKPTYGLVSRSGVVAMASSTDTIGPIARTVADTALVLDVLAGRDDLDSTTIERDSKSYTSHDDVLSGCRIGVVKEFLGEGIADDVKTEVLAAVESLKAKGAIITDVSLPSLSLALACYYIVMPAEVSSNLSRYDGQRYGYSHADATNLEDSYSWSRSEGFGEEAKRRIMIGSYVLSSGYYDAYYNKAQQVRTKLINEFEEVFESVDFLLGPTAPTRAFKIGENSQNPLAMYLADIMTVAASLVGIAAISVPISVKDGELPIGLQIMAPQKHDRQLLSLAAQAQEVI